MMRNLAELILRRATETPHHRFGLAEAPMRLANVVDVGRSAAAAIGHAGLGPGSVVAVIGSNSNDYVVTWAALQLAGLESALLNPAYPPDLLSLMIKDLRPMAVVRVGPTPEVDLTGSDVLEVDTSSLSSGELTIGTERIMLSRSDEEPVGVERAAGDIAGYMHTSGTTGNPKFCAQSHEYFLRLGRFVANSMCLGRVDAVYAPLPLFHVNPLGYGAIGALAGGAEFLTSRRFSASGFWPEVITSQATALILHAPPVEILKRATNRADAAGHVVRVMFYTDTEFLETYEVPVGLSAYGSTEAAGLTHINVWRRGDLMTAIEGASHVAGQPRSDVDCRIGADGEIQVRGRSPHVLFEGYRIAGRMVDPRDEDGWFATGDSGRFDDSGNLVFIERLSEAVRVKGEFVPLSHVEAVLTAVPGIAEAALWKRAGVEIGDELVAYVVADWLDSTAIEAAVSALPTFMRPRAMVRLEHLPKDGGVGKVRRRELAHAEALDVLEL